MSYLLIDEALDLLDDAVDEGLHELMAVCSFIGGPDGAVSGILTPDGGVDLADVKLAIRNAFRDYAKEVGVDV